MVADIIVIFSLALVVLFTTNIFYKLLVNQNQVRQIRENVNTMNKQMREEQKAGNTEKVSQMMSDIMREQGKLMRMNMKPLIISFVIISMFIFTVGNTYGDRTSELVDNAGTVMIDDQEYSVSRFGDTVSVGSVNCEVPCREFIGGSYWKISVTDDTVNFNRIVASFPPPISLPLAGDSVGFLGWYIIVSIPTMIILRKAMKIYT